MKSRLTIFFAGLTVGMLIALLALSFVEGVPPGSRTRTTLAFELQTNGHGPVVMKRVVR
jgi:hypothetical protein